MYEIVVRGRLPADWQDWFHQFTATVGSSAEGPITTLVGPVPDQAALHGALARIRDLALPVLSVTRLPSDRPTPRANTPPTTPEDT